MYTVRKLILMFLFIPSVALAAGVMDSLIDFIEFYPDWLKEMKPVSKLSEEERDELAYFGFDEYIKPEENWYFHYYGGYTGIVMLDKANGYIEDMTEVGCGAYARTQAAAYKKNDGTYLYMRNYDYPPSLDNRHMSGIKTSDAISAVLPERFLHIAGFLPEGYKLPRTVEAAFYLKADIPRQGTETVIRIKPILLEMYAPNDDFLMLTSKINDGGNSRSFDENSDAEYTGRPEHLQKVAEGIWYDQYNENKFNDEDYPTDMPKDKIKELLLKGDSDKINTHDRNALERFSNEVHYFSGDYIIPFEHLAERIRFYYAVYEIERNMVINTIVLNWDKSSNTFIVKETKYLGERPKSFAEFLGGYPRFWEAAC